MGRSRIFFRISPALYGAAAAIAFAGPALAQTTPGGDYRDFKLPPSPASTPIVGPTDEDAPPRTATPRQPAPTPSASPRPAPTIALPPPPAATSRPPVAAPRAVPARNAAPAAFPGTAASPSAAPTTASGSLFPSAPPTASAVGGDLAPLPEPARNLSSPEDDNWWLWPLIAAAVAALGGLGWAVVRRRSSARHAAPVPDFVRPTVPSSPAPQPPSAEPAAPAPAPAAPAATGPLALSLQVTRMSATLVNAALSYRLAVTNTGPSALHEIGIAGDMIAAHSSVPDREMLGGSGTALPGLHRLGRLEPGESVVLAGEIRLPLAAITPIRRGEAQLFVPLARFAASASREDGQRAVERCAFLIGQEPEARAKLQPFRLDLGPRLYSQVGQRPIVVAA